MLQDGKEIEKISLLIPSEGKESGGPKLEMTDQAGKSVFDIPVKKEQRFVFIEANGLVAS